MMDSIPKCVSGREILVLDKLGFYQAIAPMELNLLKIICETFPFFVALRLKNFRPINRIPLPSRKEESSREWNQLEILMEE